VLDLRNGGRKKAIDYGGRVLASAALIEGMVFACSTSGLVVEIDPLLLQPKGALLLPAPITSPIIFDPENKLFMAMSNAGELFAFRRIGRRYSSGSRRDKVLEPETNVRMIGAISDVSHLLQVLDQEHGRDATSFALDAAGCSAKRGNEAAQADYLSGGDLLTEIARSLGGEVGSAVLLRIDPGLCAVDTSIHFEFNREIELRPGEVWAVGSRPVTAIHNRADHRILLVGFSVLLPTVHAS